MEALKLFVNEKKKKTTTKPSYLVSVLSRSLISVWVGGQYKEKGETLQTCLFPKLSLFTLNVSCKKTLEETGRGEGVLTVIKYATCLEIKGKCSIFPIHYQCRRVTMGLNGRRKYSS